MVLNVCFLEECMVWYFDCFRSFPLCPLIYCGNFNTNWDLKDIIHILLSIDYSYSEYMSLFLPSILTKLLTEYSFTQKCPSLNNNLYVPPDHSFY